MRSALKYFDRFMALLLRSYVAYGLSSPKRWIHSGAAPTKLHHSSPFDVWPSFNTSPPEVEIQSCEAIVALWLSITLAGMEVWEASKLDQVIYLFAMSR
jgi:hypothetical protein